MIELKDSKTGDIFTVEGDDRIFKVLEANEFPFYVYALQDETQEGKPVRWRLDYEEAKRLIERFNLIVEYARITHTPTDNIYLSPEIRKETGCFRQIGIRYVAEASIRNGTVTIVRTGSAGADNVSWPFMTWAPDIACKRAVIKCVLDSLGIEKIEPEIIPADILPQDKSKDEPSPDEPRADKTQLAAIKALCKRKKTTPKKVLGGMKINVVALTDLTGKQAERIIKELQK